MSAITVTKQNFEETVQESDQAVLVDFWAPWCGPCRAMSQVVDELAEEVAGQAKVVKANVDELAGQAAKFGVYSLPSFFVVRNGEIVERMTGVVSKEKLRSSIESHLN